jgi:predicted acylesterase/phospholipase RssA
MNTTRPVPSFKFFIPHESRAKRQRKNLAMNFQLRPNSIEAQERLPFECVALLLQGGGALGAYQGGVYDEALAETNIHPDWIAGISIGAINAAIIAGNPPNSRVDRLREFWTGVTSSAPWHWSGNPFIDLAQSDDTRNLLNSNERQSGGGVRRGRILFRATADAVVATGRHAGIDQPLRYQATQGHSGAPGGL